MTIFHLAIPTHDLDLAKNFYHEKLGCQMGREYPGYVIFNFFGHQLVTHCSPKKCEKNVEMYPRHLGIIFDSKEKLLEIYALAKKENLNFFEDLFERMEGKPSHHWTFFLIDPSNNLIEFKYYENQESIC